ncbi:F-box/FBD/LRR-repeat protein At1g13570-like [Rutidosis leptorrhynchoides]|uniref:F-box/FBD/LRR-repeat protein At1g13570-like n=1 Tax=Rutidosis leptorrhynchoides TaxID=125765 RepID=UPI003A9987C7
MIKEKLIFRGIPDQFNGIVQVLSQYPLTNNIWNILNRIAFAACVYFVWQESNYRCFKNKKRSADVLGGVVQNFIRLKLVSMKIKSSKAVYSVAKKWDLIVTGNRIMESTSSVSMCEASKFAVEDVINTMPSNVVSCILDFLPLQDAVRTSILSKNWRYKWTTINQVVFDNDLFEYIMRTKGDVDGRIITRVLVYHEGSLTKFVLHVPRNKRFDDDDDDIYLWVKLLSTKSVKGMIIVNKNITPIVLPTLVFSCVDLKHLKLCRCGFRNTNSLGGFSKLSSLDLDCVNSWELIGLCPLLEVLQIYHPLAMTKMKLDDFAKLKNLKHLFLSLRMLYHHDAAIPSLDTFKLVGCLLKLHRLTLDLQRCSTFKVDAAGNRDVMMHSFKVLEILNLDYDNRSMVFFFFDLIQGTDKDRVFPSPVTLDQVKAGITGYLQQLRNVDFVYLKDSHVELSFIKCLLDNCCLLQLITIANYDSTRNGTVDRGRYFDFSAKLLLLSRASPEAKILFRP